MGGWGRDPEFVTAGGRQFCRSNGILFSTLIARKYTYSVVLEPDEEGGGFVADVPALPGCHTEGDTRDEAITMAQDAITGYIESLLKHDEPIPVEQNPTGPVVVTVTVKTDVQTQTTAA